MFSLFDGWLFVCLLTRLLKKLYINCHEIRWIDRPWDKAQSIRFCVWSRHGWWICIQYQFFQFPTMTDRAFLDNETGFSKSCGWMFTIFFWSGRSWDKEQSITFRNQDHFDNFSKLWDRVFMTFPADPHPGSRNQNQNQFLVFFLILWFRQRYML